MLALAGMTLATSCSQEADLNGNYGKPASVKFNVALDEVAATRAISDASQTNILYYEIYNADGTLATEGTETVSNKTANFEVELISGNSYQVAFWAQNSACTAYNTEDLRAVTINYSEVKNNDESMDAFFNNATLDVNGDATQSVTLKRPFAQVNVGVAVDNFEGLGINESAVTVNEYYDQINLLTGAVSKTDGNTGSLTFVMNAVPDASQEYFTVNGANYNYLSTTYLLAAATSENVNLNFVFSGDKNYTLDYENVPVMRNYRTNILTNQDMDKINFTITVDPNFEADNETLYGDLLEGEVDGNKVTLSNVQATVQDNVVNFTANYTGIEAAAITSASFICTPNATRADEGVVTVPATSWQNGVISASAQTSEFAAGTTYTYAVSINNQVIEAESSEQAPSFSIPGTSEPEPETPEVKEVTIQQFNEAEVSETQVYQLTGTVSDITSTIYGNFTLTDDSGSVLVYGLSTTPQEYGAKNDQTFSETKVKEGDKITIQGYRGVYNTTIEVMNAWLITIDEAAPEPEIPAGQKVVTFDFTKDNYGLTPYNSANPNSTTYLASTETATQDGVSIEFTSNIADCWRMWSDGIRAYRGASNGKEPKFTVSAGGKTITNVTLTVVSGATFNVAGYLDGANTKEWSGSAEEVTFNYTATSNKAIVTIAVTYEE